MTTYGIGYGGVSVYGGAPPSTRLADGGVPVMGGGMPYEEPAEQPAEGRCHHTKTDGTLCKRWPKKESMYCPLHRVADETVDLIDEALADKG